MKIFNDAKEFIALEKNNIVELGRSFLMLTPKLRNQVGIAQFSHQNSTPLACACMMLTCALQ